MGEIGRKKAIITLEYLEEMKTNIETPDTVEALEKIIRIIKMTEAFRSLTSSFYFEPKGLFLWGGDER